MYLRPIQRGRGQASAPGDRAYRGRGGASRAQKSYTGPGPKQADGCPAGRHLRRGSPDIVDLIPLEARESICGGKGTALRYWTICLWE